MLVRLSVQLFCDPGPPYFEQLTERLAGPVPIVGTRFSTTITADSEDTVTTSTRAKWLAGGRPKRDRRLRAAGDRSRTGSREPRQWCVAVRSASAFRMKRRRRGSPRSGSSPVAKRIEPLLKT